MPPFNFYDRLRFIFMILLNYRLWDFFLRRLVLQGNWVQSGGPELVGDEDGDNDEVNSRAWSWPSGFKYFLALILPIFSRPDRELNPGPLPILQLHAASKPPEGRIILLDHQADTTKKSSQYQLYEGLRISKILPLFGNGSASIAIGYNHSHNRKDQHPHYSYLTQPCKSQEGRNRQKPTDKLGIADTIQPLGRYSSNNGLVKVVVRRYIR
ncbi:hypothetical protein C8J55DRAFT_487531 [Lentinula edodes]|uniref:Uncharacterized protein n=1 Tax=Lentinula lateritia TaxID=40482 RepID=A0A9W9AMH0_9AGAR|nr:hypothetical protein C8J55DRAFT_487531 [Lentinula edodes]